MIFDCVHLNGFSQQTTDELIDIALVFGMISYLRFGSRVRCLQVKYLLLFTLIKVNDFVISLRVFLLFFFYCFVFTVEQNGLSQYDFVIFVELFI